MHSIVIVALGASLGREAAPQQAGAAIASTLGDRAGFPEWQRRLLVACGAGAGMAAVYNIPFGGALFALEVLLGNALASLRATGARDLADRDGGRLGLHPESPHLPDRRTHHASDADRVGRDRRAGRGARVGALRTSRRRRQQGASAGGACASVGADRGVPRAGHPVDRLPAGARKRQGRRPAHAHRSARGGPHGRAAHPEASGDGGLPGLRRAGRPVHPHARGRRAARQPRRQGLGAAVAGSAARHLRRDRRRSRARATRCRLRSPRSC